MDPRQPPPHPPQGHPQQTGFPGYNAPPPPKKKRWPLVVGILVLLAVAGAISLLFLPSGIGNLKKGIAIVASADQVLWGEGDIEPVPGTSIEAGVLGIESGKVVLAFHNGLKVTFFGPGQIEIQKNEAFFLRKGKLLVEQDKRRTTNISVSSKHLDLTTDGGSFSVRTPNDKIDGYHVYTKTGTVNAVFTPPKGARTNPILLAEDSHRKFFIGPKRGDTPAPARASSPPPPKKTSPPKTEKTKKKKKWSRVNVEFVEMDSPPPSVVNPVASAAGRCIYFKEQENVTLSKDLAVDLAEPGSCGYHKTETEPDGYKAHPGATLAAGTVLTSYFLHLEADPEKRGQNISYFIERDLTFDAPIVGLIGSHKKMRASDGLCGHPDTQYPDRNHRPRSQCDFQWGDGFTLSEDRRTVSIRMSTSRNGDTARILVGTGKSEARGKSDE